MENENMDAKSPAAHQRLSGADAAFLYLERKEIPLHIACVCTFEAVIPYEEFVATIDSKLHLLPRYRQLAVNPPFGIGYPNWEYDRHFDIRRHILRTTVNAPGGEAELEELAGRIFSVVMSRDKPLWEVYVVEGLRGGRGALIAKVHHALADGIAGASLLRVMLDPTAEGSHAIRKPHFQPPEPRPEPSLTDAIASAIHGSLENLVAAEAGLLDIAQGLLSDRTQQGLQGLVTLLPEIVTPVQRLPFNRPCGGERKFCWAEFDFADVKAIRNVTGGTVNDVILTVVTRAVAKYVTLHGESIAGRLVRMVCPVSVRKDEQGESLGNRISFLPVTLPLDAENPVEHLKAIALRTAIMKSARAAELVGIAASWLGAAPPPAQALFWWGIPLVPLPAPLLNLICTNVPGSPAPLYSVGKRMLASYPHVPTGYELGVGVAVQSYNGTMCFGLTADAVVAPDVGRLRDFIRASWDELCRAAGVRQTPHQPEITGKRPVRKTAAAKAVRAAVPKPAAARSSRARLRPLAAEPASVPQSAPPAPQPTPVQEPAPAARSSRARLRPLAAEPASVPQSAPPAPQPTPVQEPAPAARSSRARLRSLPAEPAPVPQSAPPAPQPTPVQESVPAARSSRARLRPRPLPAQSASVPPSAPPAPEPAPVQEPVPAARSSRARLRQLPAQPASVPQSAPPAPEPAPVQEPAPAARSPRPRPRLRPLSAEPASVQQSAPPAPELETAEVPPPLAHVNIA